MADFNCITPIQLERSLTLQKARDLSYVDTMVNKLMEVLRMAKYE